MAAVRHLGFLKFNFLTVGAVKNPISHRRTEFRKDRNFVKCATYNDHCYSASSFSLRRYRDFCDFHDGGGRHLGFLTIPNFNGLSALRGQFASLYHISSKSAKILPRYGDLMDFKKWRPSTISD